MHNEGGILRLEIYFILLILKQLSSCSSFQNTSFIYLKFFLSFLFFAALSRHRG